MGQAMPKINWMSVWPITILRLFVDWGPSLSLPPFPDFIAGVQQSWGGGGRLSRPMSLLVASN